MKLIQGIPELEKWPVVFNTEEFDEDSACKLLGVTLNKAEEVLVVVKDAFKEEWTTTPSTNVRAVFGHWQVEAMRHFLAIICLCKNHDLSIVADVHYRQIFEIYIQIRYYASLDQAAKERHAEKMYAIGFIDYLDKMSVLKDHEKIKSTYKEISDALTQCDSELVNEINQARKKKQFKWFSGSFSQLAEKVSRTGEDLRRIYQMISADVHGTLNLALDVHNPKPGHLDFRGYPDVATLYLRATEMLYQVLTLYLNLWNEIAKSVGAESVNFASNTDA